MRGKKSKKDRKKVNKMCNFLSLQTQDWERNDTLKGERKILTKMQFFMMEHDIFMV